MFDDDSPPSPSRPASHLLDELESIKGILAEAPAPGDQPGTDIPLLDDRVSSYLNDHAKLLNIAQIFEEEAAVDATTAESPVPFPRFTLNVAISDELKDVTAISTVAAEPCVTTPAAAAPKPRAHPDYNREVLIQALIDEFIPQIEAELHRRLQQLDNIALQQLKDSN